MHKKELLLLKITALISLIGLLVISLVYNIKTIDDPKTIISNQSDEYVEISGVVENIHNTPTVLIITLENMNNTKIIASIDSDYQINKGDFIKVSGKQKEFSNILQIEAENIQIS